MTGQDRTVDEQDLFVGFIENLRVDLGLASEEWPNTRILKQAMPPLLLELSRQRNLGSLTGTTSRSRFQRFEQCCEHPDYLSVFKEQNPGVVKRILRDDLREKKLRERVVKDLSSDWPRLYRYGYVSKCDAKLPKKIERVGDWHDDQPTVRVVLASRTIYYKGRQNNNARAMRAIWDKLSDGSNRGLLPMKWEATLTCGDHAWSKEAKRAPLPSRGAAISYYTRMGQLLFLAYLLKISDLHYENVVPCGEYPIVVDDETIASVVLSQEFRDLAASDAEQAIRDSLSDSVLLTGMLPLGALGSDGADVSAIGAESIRHEARVLCDVGMDTMHYERGVSEVLVTEHLPFSHHPITGNEVYERAIDHVRYIGYGFSSAYDAYLAKSDEMSRTIADELPCADTRVLVRNTSDYSVVLQALASERYRGRADWVLQRLRSARSDLGAAVIDSECETLLSGMIPAFHCLADKRAVIDVRGNEVLRLTQSPYESLVAHMNCLSEVDKHRQLDLIEFALSGQRQMQEKRWSSEKTRRCALNPVHSRTVLRDACRKLTELIDEAAVIGDDGSVSWESLTVDDKDCLTLRPLSHGMYDGIEGVQYGLSRRSKLPTIECRDAGGTAYSAYVGISSAMLSMQFEAAEVKRCAEHDIAFDVLGGSAGVILALRNSGGPEASSAIDVLAHKLLRARLFVEGVPRWPLGDKERVDNASFAHGNAGIGVALLVAGLTTNSERYVREGISAIDSDDRLRLPGGLWCDARRNNVMAPSPYWCHGVGGLTVARLLAVELDDEVGNTLLPRGTRRRYLNDIKTAARYLVESVYTVENFSLCHGVAGILLILDHIDQAGFTGGLHHDVSEAFRRFAEFGLAEDWRCGTNTHQSYGLMTGLAGVRHAIRVYSDGLRTLEPLLPISAGSAR